MIFRGSNDPLRGIDTRVEGWNSAATSPSVRFALEILQARGGGSRPTQPARQAPPLLSHNCNASTYFGKEVCGQLQASALCIPRQERNKRRETRSARPGPRRATKTRCPSVTLPAPQRSATAPPPARSGARRSAPGGTGSGAHAPPPALPGMCAAATATATAVDGWPPTLAPARGGGGHGGAD